MSEQKQATPHAELLRQIMDPNVPKNEMGWAAAREIERLRAALRRIEEIYAPQSIAQAATIAREALRGADETAGGTK